MSAGAGGIVFDLDGTLIDSAPDIRAAINRTLAAEGAAPLTLDETVAFIGDGIPALVARARAARALPETRQGPMAAAMLAHYAADPVALTAPYPGVVAALEALAAAGFALGICTNKPHGATCAILDALGLARHFAVVVGGDSLPVRKPDPAPLRAAFAPLGRAVLYVGDSEVDALTARAAAIPFALFTEGYRKAPAEALPHRFAFARFADLPDRLARARQT